MTDRVLYYRSAYVIQKFALFFFISDTDLFLCVPRTMYMVITTVCVTPLHPPPPNSQYPESTFFTFLIEIAEKRTDNLTVVFMKMNGEVFAFLRVFGRHHTSKTSLIMTVTLSWKRVKPPNLPRQRRASLLA